jgi:HPt (histidine-containing phosphotransfer) domain-containing protein
MSSASIETSIDGPCLQQPMPAPPVDLEHLSRYTLGDRALEQEVLQLFAAELPVMLERLRSANTDRAWREAAHTIKGSARAVGAWKIAGLAEEAERLVMDDGRRAAVGQLRVSVEEAVRFIMSLKSSNA